MGYVNMSIATSSSGLRWYKDSTVRDGTRIPRHGQKSHGIKAGLGREAWSGVRDLGVEDGQSATLTT
jgi:hypothetical protein